MTPQIILGPPGTGKTTDMIRIVEWLLEDGYAPHDICFVAFTRKAASEARVRSMAKFNFNADQLPWFRTIHSMAFHQLGYAKHQIMGLKDYYAVANSLGLNISINRVYEEGVIMPQTKGDRLLFAENMARSRLMSLRDYWELHPNEDIPWYELKLLSDTILRYKESNGKCDFTDLIHKFVETPVVPNIRALLVDEAQDLTPLQWRAVEALSRDVEEYFIAGDDDQAIFKWAGADVAQFMSMPGERRVLPRSYRVPELVQDKANEVVSRIQDRIPKTWLPREDKGEVRYEVGLDGIDMSTGSWLLLARNSYLLERYNTHCLREGLVFDSHIGSPIRGTCLRAIVAWEELRKGGTVSVVQAREIYDHMSTRERIKFGCKQLVDKLPDAQQIDMAELRRNYGLLTEEIWHVAMDRIEVTEREYFISALRRGEKLLRTPRIRIETIHGAKGGEADNVVLTPDMAERTWREMTVNPDDEHRVWYVAITRARERLWILSPASNRYYDL